MDSMNKYGSDGVPFTGEVAEHGTTEQQVRQICDAFARFNQSIIDVLVPTLQAVADAILPVLQGAIETFGKLQEAFLKSYPDKRIVHLAFHGKTARIRKKNRSRIAKYIKKELKRSG